MMEFISEFFQIFYHELIVIFASALPVVELKGSIPLGLSFGLDPVTTFVLSVAGCMLPVPFILKYLKVILKMLYKVKWLEGFADWIVKRSSKKSSTVEKYSLLGLFIFVAIPLPTTGVWTGSIIAVLLGLNFKSAFISIALGTIVSAFIVIGVSMGLL